VPIDFAKPQLQAAVLINGLRRSTSDGKSCELEVIVRHSEFSLKDSPVWYYAVELLITGGASHSSKYWIKGYSAETGQLTPAHSFAQVESAKPAQWQPSEAENKKIEQLLLQSARQSAKTTLKRKQHPPDSDFLPDAAPSDDSVDAGQPSRATKTRSQDRSRSRNKSRSGIVPSTSAQPLKKNKPHGRKTDRLDEVNSSHCLLCL
jgi:hypothetical protein